MFLKRIEIIGFKSFADKTIIDFNYPITGIVGPNGCGKSNITDAIRWVLGEQSVKSLRATNMNEVIFAGSTTRKPVNYASVTLVFDNSNKTFPIEFNEVEITRRVFRNSSENEYFINKTPCRLKDIQNLILDSGLGKDSLSVISQGNISAFAESKPEDRKAIFDDAAGVGKYKKRKVESLNKLNRTKDNLARLSDLKEEISKQVAPLAKASAKAKVYIEKKAKLEEIEISVICADIENVLNEQKDNANELYKLETKQAYIVTTQAYNDNKYQGLKEKQSSEDSLFTQLNDQLLQLSDDIRLVENQKLELDHQRKYKLNTESDENKTNLLRSIIEDKQYELKTREGYFNNLKANLKNLSNQMNEQTLKSQNLESERRDLFSSIQKLKNEIAVLEDNLKQPYQNQLGVSTIIESKIDGVYGTCVDLLKPNTNYEQAITNALGGAMYHVVVEDVYTAKKSINYLKRNKSGKATFLPIEVLKPNVIGDDALVVAKTCEGYLGIANEFITYNSKYENIVTNLLANIIIVDTIDNATNLAKMMNYRYKIITLAGDIIHKGGSLTGGYHKQVSLYAIESKLANKQELLVELEHSVSINREQSENLAQSYNNLQAQMLSSQLDKAKVETQIENDYSDLNELQAQLKEVNPEHQMSDIEAETNTLTKQLLEFNYLKEHLTNKLAICRDAKEKSSLQLEHLDAKNRQLRIDYQKITKDLHDLELQTNKLQVKLDYLLERLSNTYEMTYEHAQSLKQDIDLVSAKTEVFNLRKAINELGNVNLDACEEYEVAKERLEVITKQIEELEQASSLIVEAIKEMDEVMIEQFTTTFDLINNELDGVFKSLFGGGSAKLRLDQPDNVLESGVDIDVLPPGKALTNIKLFSGGEKSLIAIAVLFAILKVKQIPLCIFDEVEAALDQVNVERFATYLKHFNEQSQFLVVTHRSGTMVNCEQLFGVTMQKNGISSVLSVELNDAYRLIQD